MKTSRLKYPSADGETIIRGYLWQPDVPVAYPRGVVQLVTGILEGIESYEPFARYLVERGYVVCGHSHVGFGLSQKPTGEPSTLPAEGGDRILVADMEALHDRISSWFGHAVPYILIGHSMGSSAARVYAQEHGRTLAALVVTGAYSLNDRDDDKLIGMLQAQAEALGDDHLTEPEELADARDIMARLGSDSDVPNPHAFATLGAETTCAKLSKEAGDPQRNRQVPAGLPCLFVSGENDAVSKLGKGTEGAVEGLRKAGVKHVDLYRIPNFRHAILNRDYSRPAWDYVSQWLEGHDL
jgi:alpha-beta hydrolase superfamily lysophospholipase